LKVIPRTSKGVSFTGGKEKKNSVRGALFSKKGKAVFCSKQSGPSERPPALRKKARASIKKQLPHHQQVWEIPRGKGTLDLVDAGGEGTVEFSKNTFRKIPREIPGRGKKQFLSWRKGKNQAPGLKTPRGGKGGGAFFWGHTGVAPKIKKRDSFRPIRSGEGGEGPFQPC